MSDLESILRRVIREELRATLEEMIPQFTSQQITKEPEPEVELLLSTRDAAKRLAISERTLFGLTKSGQLSCVRLGMAKRYSVETIKKWIQKSEVESDQHPNSSHLQSTSTPEVQMPVQPKAVKPTGTKRTSKKKPKSLPKARPQAIQTRTDLRKRDEEDEPPNPWGQLVDESGVDRAVLSTISIGDLMRFAGIDIPTFHGWRYLGRPMPEEAIEKLREYFRRLRKPE